jgi:hypothetical protein
LGLAVAGFAWVAAGFAGVAAGFAGVAAGFAGVAACAVAIKRHTATSGNRDATTSV